MFLSVALFLSGAKDFFELNQRTNSLVKTLTSQYRKLYFGNIEPTSVFGCVVNFESMRVRLSIVYCNFGLFCSPFSCLSFFRRPNVNLPLKKGGRGDFVLISVCYRKPTCIVLLMMQGKNTKSPFSPFKRGNENRKVHRDVIIALIP